MRNILDWIEEKKQQYEGHEPRIMAQEPRNMAEGGVIGKPGGIVEPGVEYYSTSKVYNEKTGHIYPGGNVHGKWWSDKPGRNQSPKILNDPDYIKILKERIGDPKYKNKNYKDLVREKVITDREYRALTKLGIDAQFIGKHYSDVKAKARAEAEKKWFKKYSKPSIESKTRGTTDIHKHHAGALRERVTTETTMPLEARINVKEIRKFENAINDIQNRQYKNNLNRSLPASKKKLVFEALAKEEAALRAANPEFSPYKSSLVFEESALGKGTFKFKEVMEKPELTVSEGKTGQKIAYKSATEKETQKIIDLTKDFMENRKLLIEKAKANAALKTAKKGGFGKQVKEICGLAKGGRIGFALGPDSCPLIESDPKRFLNEIVKVDKGVVGKFFKTPQAAKFAKNIARSALSVANPTTWIGGEAFYVGLEGMNSHSKGVPWLEAFDDAFIFYDFERVNKNIEDIASKMNLDENSMALLKNTMNINKLDSDMGKVQSQLEMVESDPLSEIDVGSSHKRIDEIKGQLDNEIQSYMSNVGKLFNKDPNTLDDSEIYKGFDILSNVFRKKVLTERQDAYKDIATRADPLAGNLGNWLNTNLFNLDVWKPQHLLTTKLTPQQEKQKYLDEIGNEFIPGTKIPNPKYNPRELYLYNKDARNLTYDSPLVDEALALRSESQPVLG
ncbi:MAG: hypothetical protein H8E55_05490, partial [Pelagibacterales bacterium]|nr:hypothetical protein [Pelagibacterales bacterium]